VPEVEAAMAQALDTAKRLRKPRGLTTDASDVRQRLGAGWDFITVGSDVGVPAGLAAALRAAGGEAGMTPEEFRASTAQAAPPPGLAAPLAALWWDAKGDWDRAHEHAQAVDDADGALVHAYLHRKEGDLANAGYWYGRAGRPRVAGPLEEEWTAIAAELLLRRATPLAEEHP
jgi:hypothetical protein